MQSKQTIDDPALSHDEVLHRLGELKPGDSVEIVQKEDPSPLLRRMLEAVPLRYDFAPLERGPSRWRTHVRVREDRGPRGVMRYLAWDHDRLDALLNEAVRLARADQWREVHALIVDFRTGLFRHIEVEEKDLFPAFERIAEDGPTTVMRHEHEAIRESVEDILSATVNRHLDDFERFHADLLGVLIEHNMKEENILYPLTDRGLDDDARRALVEQMMLH
jgi:uncharacterized protein (DUF2249 family)/hemerythrin-like domain-containing protein